MKRLLVIFTIFCASNITLLAQKDSIITDFLEEGTAWVEVRPSYYFFHALKQNDISGAQAEITYYYITSDTIVRGVKYWNLVCKVLYNHHLDVSYGGVNYAYIGLSDEGVLREKFFFNAKDTSHILYDFGKQYNIGNRIRYAQRGDYNTLSECTVEKIDTITFLNGIKGLIANDEYIYGLGHKSHPFYWAFVVDDGNEGFDISRFLCLFYRGEIILQDEELMEQIKKSIGMDADHILPPTFNDRTDTDAPIYDLTGRRLNSVPEKGVYIQGGKKRVVK